MLLCWCVVMLLGWYVAVLLCGYVVLLICCCVVVKLFVVVVVLLFCCYDVRPCRMLLCCMHTKRSFMLHVLFCFIVMLLLHAAFFMLHS